MTPAALHLRLLSPGDQAGAEGIRRSAVYFARQRHLLTAAKLLMLFSPEERILLLNILPPAEGSMIFLRSVRRLRECLAFSEEEIKDWSIMARSLPARGFSTFSWDTAKAIPVEIEVTDNAASYIEKCLIDADSRGRLHEGLIRVYDSFVVLNQLSGA